MIEGRSMSTTSSTNQPGPRIVVTGIGIVSPVGCDAPSSWDAIVSGKSGIARITRFDPTGYQTTFAGEVKDFDPVDRLGRKDARRTDRYTHFAVASALEALEHAGLAIDDANRRSGGGAHWVGDGGRGNARRRHGDRSHRRPKPAESVLHADVSRQHGFRNGRHRHWSERTELRAGVGVRQLGSRHRRSGGDHQARRGRRHDRRGERSPSGSDGGGRIQRHGRLVDPER